jgi:hypothetical protein
LDDGEAHPFEGHLRRWLDAHGPSILVALAEALRDGSLSGTSAAGVIQCLSRIDFPAARHPLLLAISESCIDSEYVTVRDAVVRLLEAIGTAEAREILTEHSESVHWLKDYISQVIEDLR